MWERHSRTPWMPLSAAHTLLLDNKEAPAITHSEQSCVSAQPALLNAGWSEDEPAITVEVATIASNPRFARVINSCL